MRSILCSPHGHERPEDKEEEFDTALSAMIYGTREYMMSPPTIAEIARGDATARPKAVKRTSQQASRVQSTAASSPSLETPLELKRWISWVQGKREEVGVTERSGKVVRFAERVTVVDVHGRRETHITRPDG